MAKAGRGQTRRDSKRRVLRPGESIRADGKYQYKYHIDGKPHFVYSWKLEPTENVQYPYYGRLEEIDFLERLYDLDNMKSIDSRHENAKGDIIRHTINNDDYPYCWVFEDDRFGLANGSDEMFLRFIC